MNVYQFFLNKQLFMILNFYFIGSIFMSILWSIVWIFNIHELIQINRELFIIISHRRLQLKPFHFNFFFSNILVEFECWMSYTCVNIHVYMHLNVKCIYMYMQLKISRILNDICNDKICYNIPERVLKLLYYSCKFVITVFIIYINFQQV